MNIIPKPQKQEFLTGEIPAPKSVSVSGEKYPKVEAYLTGFTSVSNQADITLLFKKDSSFKPEEYEISISDSLTVTSADECGAFRAASTIKQLFGCDTLKKQVIRDYPDILNRGVMVDISRGKIPNMSRLFEIADILADIKYNQLQLYMDGFVFDYAHFPEYCKDTCPITADELKELINYCNDRFISLVPNQNGFGHMEKWLKKPELKHLAITPDTDREPDTVNPFDEGSLELIDTIYSDLLPHFDSKFVNVGMDEPFTLGMGQTKQRCEEEGIGNVYVTYLNKILSLCNDKYNKTPMFWDDIVFSHPETLPNVHKNSIFMTWGYEAAAPFFERCRELHDKGLRFYTCPGTSSWNSFTGRYNNMASNIETAARACYIYGGEGFLLTDWGDGGNPQFFVSSILPYIYGAYCSWNYPYKSSKFQGYNYTTSITDEIQPYADKFIFGGNKVSHILRLMANYYLLENNLIANATMTARQMMYHQYKDCITEPFHEGICLNYMNIIKDEIEKLPDNTPYLNEIKCGCKMVILVLKAIIEKDTAKEAITAEFAAFKTEFKEVWLENNRISGVEIFLDTIDKFVNYIFA